MIGAYREVNMSNLCRWFVSFACCLGLQAQLLTAQDYVQEPSRKTPVLYDVDVCVVGGGLSGVGAAIGAARSGAKTLVVERTGYLGGWIRGAGLGNVVAVKGWRPSVKEGVLLDITKKMVELKAEAYPDVATVLERGSLIVTNHEMLPFAFQSLVRESGGDILYFSNYSEPIIKNRKIEAVVVETQVGRGAIRAKVFIDCTGLATLAADAGAPTKREESFMGLATWVSGVDIKRFDDFAKTRPKEGSPELRKWMEGKLGHPITRFTSSGPSPMNYPWDDWWERNSGIYGDFFRKAVDLGELPLFYRVGEKGMVSYVEGLKTGEYEVTGGIARPRTYIVGVDPTDIKAVTEAHIKSTELLFKYVQFFNKYIPGFEKAQLTRIADATLNRTGRYIESDFAPTSAEIGKDFKSTDVICVLQRGEKAGLYEVPYRALLPRNLDNLLAVGKSSSGGLRFRTHMLSLVMGQSAGIAAAISARDQVLPRQVSIPKLQAALRKAGIELPNNIGLGGGN
jgi:hypothetical protein